MQGVARDKYIQRNFLPNVNAYIKNQNRIKLTFYLFSGQVFAQFKKKYYLCTEFFLGSYCDITELLGFGYGLSGLITYE